MHQLVYKDVGLDRKTQIATGCDLSFAIANAPGFLNIIVVVLAAVVVVVGPY